MTKATTISMPDIDTSTFAAEDPRVPLARTIALAGAVVGHVDSDNAANASPCPDWNAGLMAGHIVAVLDRLAGFPQGIEGDSRPLVHTDLAPAWLDAFQTSAQEVQRIWADDSVLEGLMVLPFATLPGAVTLGIYTAEITVHTWDLATALGLDVEWHEPDVAASLGVVEFGIPEIGRDDVEMPFAPVTPIADDAPTIERLVAWMGRRP